MKLSYFEDSDTLHIELASRYVDEIRDLDENTLLELDEQGGVVGLTIEHAGKRMDLDKIILSGLVDSVARP